MLPAGVAEALMGRPKSASPRKSSGMSKAAVALDHRQQRTAKTSLWRCCFARRSSLSLRLACSAADNMPPPKVDTQSLGVVHVCVVRPAAVDRLPKVEHEQALLDLAQA